MDYDFSLLSVELEDYINDLLKRYQGLIVACSGGLDSTVLLELIYSIYKIKKNFYLAICHVNFGLRAKASDADEAFLAKKASAYGVPFFSHGAGQAPSSNIQAWARDERYAFFERLSLHHNAAIVLAHQADDAAENVLLRMARGTSPSSMLGMSTWRPPYWRPLLEVPKSALQAWAAAQGLAYRHDQSNDKSEYNRNFIRHEILPRLEARFPGAKARIVRCAAAAEELAREKLGSTDKLVDDKGISLLDFRDLARQEALGVLARMIGREKKQLSYRFLDGLRKDLLREDSLVRQLPGGKAEIILKNQYIKVSQVVIGPKGKRYRQHQRALQPAKLQHLLGENSELELFFYGKEAQDQLKDGMLGLQLANCKAQTQAISLVKPKSQDSFRFSGPRLWTWRSLAELVDCDLAWLLVTPGKDGQRICCQGLFWQGRTWVPDSGSLLDLKLTTLIVSAVQFPVGQPLDFVTLKN